MQKAPRPIRGLSIGILKSVVASRVRSDCKNQSICEKSTACGGVQVCHMLYKLSRNWSSLRLLNPLVVVLKATIFDQTACLLK